MAHIERYALREGAKRYRVRWSGVDGKIHSKSYLLQKDAQKALVEKMRQEQLGHLWEETPQGFGEFAGLSVSDDGRVSLSGKGWFERWSASVRASTLDRRKQVISHLRELAPVRIDLITPALVLDGVSDLEKEHPRQARILHETIKMILRDAALRGQRVRPEVLELAAPAYEPARRPKALSLPELERLAKASGEPHLIRVAAYTGLRKGELFALRDQDVDLVAKTISVTGTSYKGKRYERTKTASGIRTVFLPKEAVRELKLQLMRRKGGTWVFPAPKGGAQYSAEFDPKFKRWAETAGLKVTFHDLRHTFASLMVEADTHPKILQKLMGHKHFNITMDLYTHLKESQLKTGADGLDRLLAKRVLNRSPV